jgi:SUKH-4 immunity protein
MWLSHEDLVVAFGAENVVRVDPVALQGIGLSDPAQAALTGIGLPRMVGDRAFQAMTPEVVEVPELGRFCHLGRSVNRFFSISLGSEEVLSLAGWDLARNPSFLASSVPAFVQCIAHYGMVQNALPDQRSPDVSEMWAKQLRERLEEVDPRCLTERNAYFAGRLDDIALGII